MKLFVLTKNLFLLDKGVGGSIYDVISEWPLNCLDVLINGTASEVLGMDSETVFKNTVRDSRIVTSVKIHEG